MIYRGYVDTNIGYAAALK